MLLLMLCIRLIWSTFSRSDYPRQMEMAELFSTVQYADLTRRVHKMREELCDDTLAYDLEF